MASPNNFSGILHCLSPTSDGQWSISIPENWMQGRTTYGGFSTAICYQTAIDAYPDLPPLRSAQINFIGPVGGDVILRTHLLRRGRSVTFISVDLYGEKGLALNAVFCFAVSRNSKLNQTYSAKHNQPSHEQAKPFLNNELAPAFTHNYESRIASGGQPFSGSNKSEQFIWTRHKDKEANNLSALIAIADMPPPAVLPLFKEFAPISSMTWMFNILTESFETKDGWWLLRTAAEHAQNGYSSQNMQVWNTDGELVISGRQNVAIFY